MRRRRKKNKRVIKFTKEQHKWFSNRLLLGIELKEDWVTELLDMSVGFADEIKHWIMKDQWLTEARLPLPAAAMDEIRRQQALYNRPEDSELRRSRKQKEDAKEAPKPKAEAAEAEVAEGRRWKAEVAEAEGAKSRRR